MRLPPTPLARALVLAALLAPASPAARDDGRALPPIVFVRRLPAAAGSAEAARPPLGPAAGARGRLWVREPSGAVRELAASERFADVADPAVAPDGRTIAFVATLADTPRTSLWTIALDGGGLCERPLALPEGPLRSPAWIGPDAIVVAHGGSERAGLYRPGPVFDLWRCDLERGTCARLTFERLGADAPSFDAARGRVLFARWWFNPLAAVDGRDTVSLWHAMELPPAGGRAHVAAGDPAERLGAMGYEPVALPGGDVVGTVSAAPGLVAPFGACGIQRLAARGSGRATRIAGFAPEPAESTSYGSARGLAAPSAANPAPLPDGALVFAYDAGGRGDFGLWTAGADGRRRAPLVDAPDTIECEPAVAAAWKPAWIARARAEAARFARAGVRAPGPRDTFRYADRDVFEGAGAPPRTAGARLRFYALDPAAGSAAHATLVREVAVGRDGRVDETGLPAWAPMFEELVGADGRVLRTAHGAARVAGLNVAPAGAIVRCAGCHAGHSRRVQGRPGE